MSPLTVQMVPIDQIDPHPKNPRHDLGDLAELANSITAQGIRQSLLLVPQAGPDVGTAQTRYLTVIGHRRLAAARLAGLVEVPAMVDPTIDDAVALELMLIENLQRTNLTPLEEAETYQQLLDLGITVTKIAKATGRAQKTVSARVKLLGLPEDARAKVAAGQATLDDAATIDKVAAGNTEIRAELVKSLGTSNFDWAVRQAKEKTKYRALQQPVVDQLEQYGAHAERGDEDGDMICRIDADKDYALPPIPAGAFYRCADWSAAIWIYGPADEHVKELRAQREAQEQAERVARREQQERDDAIRRAAHALRDEFVRAFYQRRKISAVDRNHIVAAIGPRILAGPYVSDWTTLKWLTGDENVKVTPKKLDKAITSVLATADPAGMLLVWLHLTTARHLEDPALRAFYELLEKLGYQVSDEERAALADPAIPDEDEES